MLQTRDAPSLDQVVGNLGLWTLGRRADDSIRGVVTLSYISPRAGALPFGWHWPIKCRDPVCIDPLSDDDCRRIVADLPHIR